MLTDAVGIPAAFSGTFPPWREGAHFSPWREGAQQQLQPVNRSAGSWFAHGDCQIAVMVTSPESRPAAGSRSTRPAASSTPSTRLVSAAR